MFHLGWQTQFEFAVCSSGDRGIHGVILTNFAPKIDERWPCAAPSHSAPSDRVRHFITILSKAWPSAFHAAFGDPSPARDSLTSAKHPPPIQNAPCVAPAVRRTPPRRILVLVDGPGNLEPLVSSLLNRAGKSPKTHDQKTPVMTDTPDSASVDTDDLGVRLGIILEGLAQDTRNLAASSVRERREIPDVHLELILAQEHSTRLTLHCVSLNVI